MKKLYFLAFFLTSCATPTSYSVKVNSIAQANTYLDKYNICYLDVRGSQIDKHSLLHKEYQSYIELVLKDNGIRVVESNKKANCVINIDYGISDPKETSYIDSVPIYGQTGYSSSNTYGNVNSYGSYNATTTYSPAYGVTGYRPVSRNMVTYTRHLSLDARKKDGKEQLWMVNALSSGSSGDLREVFPYLVAGIEQRVKLSTTQYEEFSFFEDDPKVQYYKMTLGYVPVTTNESNDKGPLAQVFGSVF